MRWPGSRRWADTSCRLRWIFSAGGIARVCREPKAIAPNEPLAYKFALPTANHVFLPGHRIMVQVQSSWFPLYDRNPQTFVPNIFFAKPEDYKKATERVYHSGSQASLCGAAGGAVSGRDVDPRPQRRQRQLLRGMEPRIRSV